MMSEAEDQRPLSRRERRIKEFGETGALPLLNADGTSIITNPLAASEEIYVDPLDENGVPRSRREIREIREQLRLERLAAESAHADVEAASSGEAPTLVEIQEVVETQALSFDEIVQVDTEVVEGRTFTELPIDTDLPTAAHTTSEPESSEQATTPETVEDAQADTVSDITTEAVAEADTQDSSHNSATVIAAENSSDADTAAVEVIAAAAEVVEPEQAEVTEIEEAEVLTAEEPEPVQAKRSTYTFPDITPLDDEVSVFDDPAVRTISGSSSAEPAFDELISRAVAQEGAAGTTNTSALILPSMPDTDGLSGPLGETGELFITGSIDLPRSFSETGGHASLIDSVEDDRFVELGAADQDPRDSGILPVSATRAVSARVIPGPVVTEAQKEKSKLPVVLISTGGGLVVVVAGLLIWGATSGMFG